MEKAVSEHFDHVGVPFYFFLTFVNNSKDVYDQMAFTLGRVNDWFRNHSICKSWFIVRELHKDGRVHYHAIAHMDYEKFKPSHFRFKIGKKILRVHIQVKINGRFLSTTFCGMQKQDGCRTFINGIRFLRHNTGNPPKRKLIPSKQRPGLLLRTAPTLASYITKSLPFAEMDRWQAWSCSCKHDHLSINNIFPKHFYTHSIIANILSYVR